MADAYDAQSSSWPDATGSLSGTVVSVAPNGTHTTDDASHLPVTPEEVANAATDCERVGAAVVDLCPRRDTELADVVSAVRARTNMLVRVTAHARSEPLRELVDVRPDILSCPLDAPTEFASELRARALANGITVHYEARALEELTALHEPHIRKTVHPESVHVVLVFDTRGMSSDVQTFTAAVTQLPTGAYFTATGLEEASLPVMLTTLAAGGNLRVGMADTLRYSEGVEVRDNTQLVARATGLAKIAQRPPLPKARAAEILAVGDGNAQRGDFEL